MERLRQFISYYASIVLVIGVSFIALDMTIGRLPYIKTVTINNKLYVKDLVFLGLSGVITHNFFRFKKPGTNRN